MYAILNFFATSDFLEKKRERSSAEIWEGEVRSRLFRLHVLLSAVFFRMFLISPCLV